jgi:hypothetical protein
MGFLMGYLKVFFNKSISYWRKSCSMVFLLTCLNKGKHYMRHYWHGKNMEEINGLGFLGPSLGLGLHVLLHGCMTSLGLWGFDFKGGNFESQEPLFLAFFVKFLKKNYCGQIFWCKEVLSNLTFFLAQIYGCHEISLNL